MSDREYQPLNQETDPSYNREPGIAVVPGSNMQKEMNKFEQFPFSKWSAGGQPGRPYEYRPFPKMVYKAERKDGRISCMAAPPSEDDFPTAKAYEQARQAAIRFTEKCQRVVDTPEELSRAFEEGWRESPQAAIEFIEGRDRAQADAAAHRNYEDRGMSDAAKRESAAAEAAHDGHLAEVPVARIRRKPGPKPKSASAA